MGFGTITDEAKTDSGLSISSEILETVVSISADEIFEYSSREHSLRIFNNSDDRFLEKALITEDFEQLFKDSERIYEDDLDVFEQLCDNIRSGNDRMKFELRILDDGEYRWYRIKMKTLKDDEESDAFEMIGMLEDVSDMKDAERRLIDKAERDPLTHIYNKATTKKLIKNYLRTDSRENFDALIIIDVDNFKQINDTFGHLFGDSILVDLSQEMQDLFRSNDVVGRIGGDEFIVFLRGMNNINHIESKANDICKIFDLLYADENGTKISGSLGIAIFPRDGDTFDELYKRADIALYTSKRAGKSCYTFYDKSKDVAELPSLPRVEQYRSNVDFLKPITEFENSLIMYTLDISGEGIDENMSSALFEKAGKHFTLGRISIYEFDETGRLSICYQWHGKKYNETKGETLSLPEKSISSLSRKFDKNDIYCIENTGSLSGEFERFLCDRQVKSCILSAKFSPEGKLTGFLTFEECVSPKAWSIEEARSANMLKKLYFNFISRII